MDIDSFITHPDYGKRCYDSDIAAIRMKTSVTFSGRIKPIKMVAEGDETQVGEMTRVSGWGDTNNAKESPEFLRAVKVPIVNFKTCRTAHLKTGCVVTLRMICAGYFVGSESSDEKFLYFIKSYLTFLFVIYFR